MGNKTSRAYGGVGAALLERTYATERPVRRSGVVMQAAKDKFGHYGELSAELVGATEYYDFVDAIKRMHRDCAGSPSSSDLALATRLMNFMIKHNIQ